VTRGAPPTYLKVEPPESARLVGTSVALERDTLAVGAQECVYIFASDGSGWREEANIRLYR
jgi:hypothetical protein